jgi:chaperonin cofactor prefoldin
MSNDNELIEELKELNKTMLAISEAAGEIDNSLQEIRCAIEELNEHDNIKTMEDAE